MRNNVSSFAKISALLVVTGCSIAYSHYAFAEGRYICGTVSKILEPSDDAFYFKVAGNFTIKGNKEKILGIYMWDDKEKSEKEIAMVESSYKKKAKIYILIDDNNHKEGDAMLAERIESNCAISAAEIDLPFIGTRFFNTAGGSGTEESITIKKDGSTIIKVHGKTGTGIEYKGKFRNPILLEDGSGWLFKGNKVYSLEDGKIMHGCRGDDDECDSDLHK